MAELARLPVGVRAAVTSLTRFHGNRPGIEQMIAELDQEIAVKLKPYQKQMELACTVPGIQRVSAARARSYLVLKTTLAQPSLLASATLVAQMRVGK